MTGGHSQQSWWRSAAALFLMAALFNYPWEMAQSPQYKGLPRVKPRPDRVEGRWPAAMWVLVVLATQAQERRRRHQLDGGHMATAMFSLRVGGTVGTVAMWTLLLLAIFVWPGLTMWAILVFFIAGTSVPPLNDVTPLPPYRRWIGYATFAILALILAPLPHSLWSAAGIHCPYV